MKRMGDGKKRVPMLEGKSLFCLMICLMWLKYISNVAVTPCQDGKASQLLLYVLCVCTQEVY